MQRRQFIRLANGVLLGGLGTLGAIATADRQDSAYSQTNPSSGGPLSIEWLGHMSFLISGAGIKILTHPFKPAGCTAKKTTPKVAADLVMISSRLLDEGFVQDLPKNTRVLYEPGAYSVSGLNIQGIRMDHDRLGGRRFGTNVAWSWQQSGIRILHLGGAAAPIQPDQRILMGRPDVLIIPVGGGTKAYNATEAQTAVNALNPKVVIPTYYRTDKASETCELTAVDEFLALMTEKKVNKLGSSSLQLTSSSLPETTSIALFS